MKIIHITFSLATQGSLKLALRQNKLIKNESVICVNDVFSVGPLTSMEERKAWLHDHLLKEDSEVLLYEEMQNEWQKMLKVLPCNVDVWIWYGQNAHEQVGLRFVMSEFAHKCNMVFGIDTTASLNRMGSYLEVKESGEISPDYFLKMRADAKLFTAENRIKLAKEWGDLKLNPSTLRIWRDGITHVNEQEIDTIIMDCANRIVTMNQDEYLLPLTLVKDTIHQMPDFVGEAYIEERILTIAKTGMFVLEGDITDIYSYKIKYCPQKQNV